MSKNFTHCEDLAYFRQETFLAASNLFRGIPTALREAQAGEIYREMAESRFSEDWAFLNNQAKEDIIFGFVTLVARKNKPSILHRQSIVEELEEMTEFKCSKDWGPLAQNKKQEMLERERNLKKDLERYDLGKYCPRLKTDELKFGFMTNMTPVNGNLVIGINNEYVTPDSISDCYGSYFIK